MKFDNVKVKADNKRGKYFTPEEIKDEIGELLVKRAYADIQKTEKEHSNWGYHISWHDDKNGFVLYYTKEKKRRKGMPWVWLFGKYKRKIFEGRKPKVIGYLAEASEYIEDAEFEREVNRRGEQDQEFPINPLAEAFEDNKNIAELKFDELDFFKEDSEKSVNSKELISELDKKYSNSPEFKERVVNQIKRPSELREAILIDRGTKCQICGYQGFEKRGGGLYAETHHMIELNEQAPKTLQSWNVLVLCPLCHRKIHYAANTNSKYLGDGWKIILENKEYVIK